MNLDRATSCGPLFSIPNGWFVDQSPTLRLADELKTKIQSMDGKYQELVNKQQTVLASDAPSRPDYARNTWLLDFQKPP